MRATDLVAVVLIGAIAANVAACSQRLQRFEPAQPGPFGPPRVEEARR